MDAIPMDVTTPAPIIITPDEDNIEQSDPSPPAPLTLAYDPMTVTPIVIAPESDADCYQVITGTTPVSVDPLPSSSSPAAGGSLDWQNGIILQPGDQGDHTGDRSDHAGDRLDPAASGSEKRPVSSSTAGSLPYVSGSDDDVVITKAFTRDNQSRESQSRIKTEPTDSWGAKKRTSDIMASLAIQSIGYKGPHSKIPIARRPTEGSKCSMTDCNVTELDKQGKPTGKKLYRAYVHCNKHGMFLRKEPKNDQYCTSIKLCSEHLEKLDRDDPTQKQSVVETEKVAKSVLPRILSCGLCNADFLCYGDYYEHMESHILSNMTNVWDWRRLSEEKQYQKLQDRVCLVCGATFMYLPLLMKHMKTHTGVPPYKCHVCPQSFAESRFRDSHMRLGHSKQTATSERFGQESGEINYLHNFHSSLAVTQSSRSGPKRLRAKRYTEDDGEVDYSQGTESVNQRTEAVVTRKRVKRGREEEGEVNYQSSAKQTTSEEEDASSEDDDDKYEYKPPCRFAGRRRRIYNIYDGHKMSRPPGHMNLRWAAQTLCRPLSILAINIGTMVKVPGPQGSGPQTWVMCRGGSCMFRYVQKIGRSTPICQRCTTRRQARAEKSRSSEVEDQPRERSSRLLQRSPILEQLFSDKGIITIDTGVAGKRERKGSEPIVEVSKPSKVTTMRKWSCQKCSKSYFCYGDCYRHLSQCEKSSEGLVECGICLSKFDYPHILVHMKEHTPDEPFKCPLCSEGFPSEKARKEHDCKNRSGQTLLNNKTLMDLDKNMEHDDRKVVTNGLEMTSKTRNSDASSNGNDSSGAQPRKVLAVVKSGHSTVISLNKANGSKPGVKESSGVWKKCVHCVTYWKCENSDQNDTLFCKICKESTIQENKKQILQGKESSPITQFICENCGMKFKCYGDFYQHKWSHLIRQKSVRILSCLVCEHPFMSVQAVTEHTTTHTSREPYMCEICQEHFATSSQKRAHSCANMIVL